MRTSADWLRQAREDGEAWATAMRKAHPDPHAACLARDAFLVERWSERDDLTAADVLALQVAWWEGVDRAPLPPNFIVDGHPSSPTFTEE